MMDSHYRTLLRWLASGDLIVLQSEIDSCMLHIFQEEVEMHYSPLHFDFIQVQNAVTIFLSTARNAPWRFTTGKGFCMKICQSNCWCWAAINVHTFNDCTFLQRTRFPEISEREAKCMETQSLLFFFTFRYFSDQNKPRTLRSHVFKVSLLLGLVLV